MLAFSPTTSSGFHNAPVTKLLLLTSVIFSSLNVFLFAIVDQSLLTFPAPIYQTLIKKPYFTYRLITGLFTYQTVGEFLFATILLYDVGRQMERFWGSLKMMCFLLWAMIGTTLLQAAIAILVPPHVIWSGLYGVIFGLLVQYWKDVPSLMKIKLLSTRFSFNEKWALYLIGFQLVVANFYYSTFAGLSGLIIGVFWRIRCIRSMHRLVPRRIVNFFRKYVYPKLNPNPMRQRRRRVRSSTQSNTTAPSESTNEPTVQNLLGDLERDLQQRVSAQQQQQQMIMNQLRHFLQGRRQAESQPRADDDQSEEQDDSPSVNNQTIEPSAEQISQLTEMGFSEEDSRGALIASNNNVEQAVTILLSRS